MLRSSDIEVYVTPIGVLFLSHKRLVVVWIHVA